MGTAVVYEPGALVARKYRLLRAIGVGGMGAVWIARNETTLAEVALKTWHANGKPDDESVATAERFRHEARLAALVSHRNIVQVFDLLDEADGSLALVMELLRGEPLDRCVLRRGGKLEPVQALAVVLPILSALAQAHRLGVVHRDVKPGNVFLTVDSEGIVVPKLVDFGIAKAPASGTAYTLEGDALGTPRYMAPEQIRNDKDLDGRADLFAVGVMLVELLTGVSPFLASSSAATLAAVLEREVDPDPAIPPALWVEIARALKKRPFERQANATEMADGLRRALGATDSELVIALQSIAPTHDVVAPHGESTPTQLASESMILPHRRGRIGWPLPFAAALAVVAIVAGVVTARRSGAPTTGAAASLPPSASATATTNASVNPTATASTTASATATANANASPSASNAVGLAGDPTAKAGPKGPKSPGPPRTGGHKGVATSPGF